MTVVGLPSIHCYPSFNRRTNIQPLSVKNISVCNQACRGWTRNFTALKTSLKQAVLSSLLHLPTYPHPVLLGIFHTLKCVYSVCVCWGGCVCGWAGVRVCVCRPSLSLFQRPWGRPREPGVAAAWRSSYHHMVLFGC